MARATAISGVSPAPADGSPGRRRAQITRLAVHDDAGHGTTLRLQRGLARRGRLSYRGSGQDGEEIPGPALEILAGGPVLARYRGGQPTAGPARDVQLHPLRVDVELHRDPGAVAGQRGGQVGGDGGHARRVDEVA